MSNGTCRLRRTAVGGGKSGPTRVSEAALQPGCDRRMIPAAFSELVQRVSKRDDRTRLDLANVRGLKALGTASHLELDLVTLGQALEALGLDRTVVNEDVFPTLLCDEPVALRIVEPLHMSLCHSRDLSWGSESPVCLPPEWRSYLPKLEGKEKRRAVTVRRG